MLCDLLKGLLLRIEGLFCPRHHILSTQGFVNGRLGNETENSSPLIQVLSCETWIRRLHMPPSTYKSPGTCKSLSTLHYFPSHRFHLALLFFRPHSHLLNMPDYTE
jgi:hypothetical protein